MSEHGTYAAGGVLWRHSPDTGNVEVALVHRPRYDDWSLPKGKVDKGETFIATAVREIKEETGYSVRLGRHLTRVSYPIKSGTKRVDYWAAEAVGGDFEVNDEVDQLRWLAIEPALRLVSYRLDRTVLRVFTKQPVDVAVTLLVRHAKAGRRSRYKGDDRLRPLDKQGRAQAEALTTQCLAFAPTDLYAADRVRCVQTLAPLSEELDTSVTPVEAFGEEEFHDSPKAARKKLIELAAAPGRAVICSQGGVIPDLLAWWAERDAVRLPATRHRKGSMWVLSSRDGQLLSADHVASPLPRIPLA